MISKIALLSNILLATVALALDFRSSPQEAPLVRRGDSEHHQLLSLSGVEPRTYETVQSSSWAGVRVHANVGDNITFITGSFITPILWGDNVSAMIWAGLDGAENCENLRAGIDIFFMKNKFSYSVWYQLASTFYAFPGISVSASDKITISIIRVNSSWGAMMMDNLSAGQASAMDVFLQAPQSLCVENAEWIVGAREKEPFANFDNVTFTAAMASGNITYTPSEPASAVLLYDLVSQPDNSNRTLLTFVNVAGTSLLVQRLLG